MFKVGRWRGEKNKIKAVFKLQFQLNQAPSVGSEVTVSLIPVDAGKPTARSEKVAVIDGTCNWENPVYETVKLVQDLRTGKINEKVYHFIVSATGSGKAGFLGEATLNLTDYADSFKPSSLSLPLQASSTGATLHVTLQRMQIDEEGRRMDENGDMMLARQQRKTLQGQLRKGDSEESPKVLNGGNNIKPVEQDGSLVNMPAHIKFPSSRDIPLYADSNGGLGKSHSFDAISASGSDTNSGIYTPRENDIKHNDTQMESTVILSPLVHVKTPQKMMTSSGDWSGTSAPDGSSDGSINSSGETELREKSEYLDEPLEKLRSEVVLLTRKVEISDLELQTLRKQIVKENRRGQDLTREISKLKEERDALERECEELKVSKRILENSSVNSQIIEDPLSTLEEIKQELNHEKNMNSNLRLQLKKTQEANAELILAVRDLDELLEQRNKETSCNKCSKIDAKTGDGTQGKEPGNDLQYLQISKCIERIPDISSENDAEEQHALDIMVMNHDNMKGAHCQEKNVDLNNEIELYRKEREDLEMQMEQLALEYEILKQENHDISSKLEQAQLREQLRMQYECSAHLAVITDLETHVENLKKELQQQAEDFEKDVETITHEKVEQEKRAIKAEEELRKAKWHNANTAERLQAETKNIAAQILYAFAGNEKLVMQALKETRKLRSEKNYLDEMLEKTNKNVNLIQGQYHMKLQQILALVDFKSQETDRLVLELKDKQQELEKCKQNEKAMLKASVEEIKILKSETEKLETEKYFLLEQVNQKEKLLTEMEELKASTKASQAIYEDKSSENEMLKREILKLKEEVTKSAKEIDNLRDVRTENNSKIRILNSELSNLRLQYRGLKHSMTDELEKERNTTFTENMMHTREGKMENPTTTTEDQTRYTESLAVQDMETNGLINKTEELDFSKNDEHTYGHSKSIRHEVKRNYDCQKEIGEEDKRNIEDINKTVEELKISNFGALSEEQKLNFVSCANNQQMTAEILSEIIALKKQNEAMGTELKEMQERYSEISLKFAEVEGERQQLVMTIRSLKNAVRN